MTAVTASSAPMRFGSGRSFYGSLICAGFFVDVSERLNRILTNENEESSDVTRKCSRTTASAFAKGQAPCPLSISHSQPACRPRVSCRLPVYAGAQPHIRALADGPGFSAHPGGALP